MIQGCELTQRCEPLEATGERMIPESTETGDFWAHVCRYKFATRYVRGKAVLDIACGEGYGSSGLLKSGALSVTGVDISDTVCRHAQNKYAIECRVGEAENIPLRDNSTDVVVSFETIEHVPRPERFLEECTRVLRKGGRAIISTPNLSALSDREKSNPFHCSEMLYDEFVSLIQKHFKSYELFSQLPVIPKCNNTGSSIAMKTHLLKMRIWYWRTSMASMFYPNMINEVKEKHRLSPDESIKNGQTFADSLLNPYAVNSSRILNPRDSMYIVAVANT